MRRALGGDRSAPRLCPRPTLFQHVAAPTVAFIVSVIRLIVGRVHRGVGALGLLYANEILLVGWCRLP